MMMHLRWTRDTRRLAMTLAAGTIAALAVSFGGGPRSEAPAQPLEAPPLTASDSPAKAPALTAGRRVTIDPATGRMSEERRSQATAAPNDGLAFSGVGLVERELPPEIGGAWIDLRGRFMTSSVVTLESDGTVRAHCQARSHAGHDHSSAPDAEDPS